MLANLRSILQRAVQQPDQLPTAVEQFLVAYDSVPEELAGSEEPSWKTMAGLAYELRYYAPGESDDDDTLIGSEAALEQIKQALTTLR